MHVGSGSGMEGQRSFDDMGTPLREVTFVVLDLETTGGNRNDDMITEVGAVKVRGGECLGTFQTLVNPGRAIPPRISVLTGLTDDAMRHAGYLRVCRRGDAQDSPTLWVHRRCDLGLVGKDREHVEVSTV